MFEVIYVEVQFYRWFKFSFLLFQAHYHTLPHPETKEKKLQTNHKIEPQHIRLHSNNKMEKTRLICILRRFGFTIYHMLHFLFLQWVLPRVPSLQGKGCFPPTCLFPAHFFHGLEMLGQTALHSNDVVFLATSFYDSDVPVEWR